MTFATDDQGRRPEVIDVNRTVVTDLGLEHATVDIDGQTLHTEGNEDLDLGLHIVLAAVRRPSEENIAQTELGQNLDTPRVPEAQCPKRKPVPNIMQMDWTES